MYIRVLNIKFASNIDAEAMTALAKYEMINMLPGIISMEGVKITELHSIVILKFNNKDFAEKAKELYLNKMKSNPNVKVEVFEGEQAFSVKKS